MKRETIFLDAAKIGDGMNRKNQEKLNRMIKFWEENLLDTGKRNSMIYYKETKRGTLKLQEPSFDQLYQKIVVEEKELLFWEEAKKETDETELPFLKGLPVPVENVAEEILAEGEPEETRKTLKNLRTKARLALGEQGTNILYLVFGFLYWKEQGGKEDGWVKSPLLLVPVSLILPAIHGRYSLKKQEDEVAVNPTLSYLFEKEYDLTLPAFDGEKDGLQDFLEKMETISKERGWQLLRECSIGLFSFQKLSLYHDLIQNEGLMRAHPVIRALAGLRDEKEDARKKNYEFDHDTHKAMESFQVLDADSSQQDAITLSQKGVSFVLQGPPGTGKSQTITNIIAQGLADGKKILFVSEKLAALDVVYRRLQETGLGDFCLPLHSHRADKKEVLAQLEHNLELEYDKIKSEEITKLTQLDMLTEQLSAYAEELHRTIQPMDMSLYEAYGCIMQREELPHISLQLPQVENMTRDQLNRLALLVEEVDQARCALGASLKENPWQGILFSYLDVNKKQELKKKLETAQSLILALESCGLQEKTLADVITVDTLDSILGLWEHAVHCGEIPADWYCRSTEQEEKQLRTLLEGKRIIDQQRRALSAVYGEDFLDRDGNELFSCFSHAVEICRISLKRWSSDAEAFAHMEADDAQLQNFQELSAALQDAFYKAERTYGLQLPWTTASMETIVAISEMLLERRNLTEKYFGEENIRKLKKYTETVCKWFETWKCYQQQLSRRYTLSVLEASGVEEQLQTIEKAMAQMEGIDWQREDAYGRLHKIAAMEEKGLQQIADRGLAPILQEISGEYSFAPPKTLQMVQQQLNAMEALSSVAESDCWKSVEWEKIHITDELLEEIAVNQAEWDSLQEKIFKLRQLYHFNDKLEDRELLQALQEKRFGAENCAPTWIWVENPQGVYDLLYQLDTLSDSLQKQRAELLEEYEEEVFELDYIGMLERFQMEYNGIFKGLKGRYKADLKEIQLISRETRGKITHEEIVDLLQSLQQYHENLEAYEALAEQAVEVFDGKTYDICDDWKWQKMWVDAFFDFCKLFVTNQDGYVFLEKAPWDDMLSLLEGAESLNRWFEENEQAKTGFGSLYHGQATDTELLRKYGEVARVFDERVTAALICGYATDKKRMAAYCQCLRRMAETKNDLWQIYSSEREYQEAASLELPVLVDQIHRYIVGANMILSVYAFVKEYEGAKGQLTVSPAMLKQDLQKILYCQREKRKSIAQQEKHRMVLGAEYRGIDTNWNTIKDNIAFSEKLHELLGGEVPQGLEDAFLKQTVHFTAARLGQLQQQLTDVRKLEKAYPAIEEKQGWEEKGVAIATVRKEMEKVFFVRDIMGRDCSYIDMVEDLSQLATLQAAQRKYEQEIAKAQRTLSVLHLTVDSDLERLAEALRHMKEIKKEIRRGEIDNELALWLTNSISCTPVNKYQEQMMRLLKQKEVLTDLTGLFSTEEALESLSLRGLGKRFGRCQEQFETMDSWIDLQECKKDCQRNGLGAFVRQGEEEEYPAGRWKDIFLKGFFYTWISAVSPSMKAVASFRMPVQEKRVEQFCTLDTHQLLVNRLRIRECLIGKMPTKQDVLWAGDQMGILLRELGKKQRLMPLRKLFREIPELLLQLKPCLMTSPLSVSYYLDLDRYQFDLVIFDEASQIFPQDAIGSILRGKQVIIAGDSKQLPPANFFTASMGDEVYDGAEEEEEIFADSILEQAAACLQNCPLLWHYRSRYEELISFSNREIYQNTLITFPSSVTQERDTGVEYIYVENGIYENRCNREEARRIVALVAEHIQNHPERSLGVIAFSESQQSMIEEEVYAYRMENPEKEWFFGEERAEPFFIKNLENVQGDERDTILFSICYGKNREGRMYLRFGPLGHEGGERRLNVAITRAKQNIKLVGSILPEDLDLSKTKAEGIRMLRAYISFAMLRGVVTEQARENSRSSRDVCCEQVRDFLVEQGWKVQMHVGSSSYRVDVAVEHPQRPGRFIAGIECDGEAYALARTVRDRERLRPAVIVGMGWRMYRVWSTEWIRSPEGEKKRLLQFIEDALAQENARCSAEKEQ